MIYKVVMLRKNHWGKRLLTLTTKKKHLTIIISISKCQGNLIV